MLLKYRSHHGILRRVKWPFITEKQYFKCANCQVYGKHYAPCECALRLGSFYLRFATELKTMSGPAEPEDNSYLQQEVLLLQAGFDFAWHRWRSKRLLRGRSLPTVRWWLPRSCWPRWRTIPHRWPCGPWCSPRKTSPWSWKGRCIASIPSPVSPSCWCSKLLFLPSGRKNCEVPDSDASPVKKMFLRPRQTVDAWRASGPPTEDVQPRYLTKYSLKLLNVLHGTEGATVCVCIKRKQIILSEP